ncbi:IRC5 [Sanghuangporus weigelae]
MSTSSTPAIMSDTEYFESTRPSSVATTPPPESESELTKEEKDLLQVDQVDDDHLPEKVKYLEDMDAQERWRQLDALLEKSAKYSDILHKQMSLVKAKSRITKAASGTRATARRGRTSRGGAKRGRGGPPSKRQKTRVESDIEAEEEEIKEDNQEEKEGKEEESFQQPSLVSGGTLKDYQLEGVAWMASLWENGISGILADEMGLGKTIQTISFCAFLRERTGTPFLIVCPLSVLHNWVDEYNKFAPQIPVVMYHGSPEHRANLRRNELSSLKDEEADEKPPVVVTTYEIIIRDRKYLEKYTWSFIAVDEGHRLKNMNCKLMQEIKKYKAGGRMVLTGTPLHNNLAELWSLLNFVLPDIFQDLDTFQQWFNIPTLSSQLTSEQTTKLITTLHSVLKPFLLRRLKVDVEYNLPPKKEYVLYAPLTEKQKAVYEAVINKSLRRFLIDNKQQMTEEEIQSERARKALERERMLSEGRKLRHRGVKRNYDVDGSDREYFKKLENGEFDQMSGNVRPKTEDTALELGKQYHRGKAVKHVNNLHLQNAVMQLRKVCSHPFLFDWPIDVQTGEEVINEELVNASGKMLVLDRLLTELFKRGHKVLLFSQFTTMLDIIEAWAIEFKGWNLCRIDGSYGPGERREEMRRFQESGEHPDAPRLFLLSTRAGGLGINLTAADTVIFYDQDWNPQMDMQAQDRCHRIGQTKPVLIFRVVTAHTIEDTIMRRATEKRKLEALVIAKGKFKVPGSLVTKNTRDKDSLAEIAASLLKLEGEKIDVVLDREAGKTEVLSDKDLDVLLDRRPKVFADRTKGWTSAHADTKFQRVPMEDKDVEAANTKPKAAFAVFEASTNEGNDALANMLGEGDGEESEDIDESS